MHGSSTVTVPDLPIRYEGFIECCRRGIRVLSEWIHSDYIRARVDALLHTNLCLQHTIGGRMMIVTTAHQLSADSIYIHGVRTGMHTRAYGCSCDQSFVTL